MAGGQYRVEAYAAEPTPPNAMNEKTIVDAGCRRRGHPPGRASAPAPRRKEVAIAISGDAAITKVIQMPRNLSDSDLEAQVEMQADQYIPFPMDEVSYDFEVLGTVREGQRFHRRAAGGHAHRERRAAARGGGGGRPHRPIVDVEAFALENACKLMTHQMPDGGIDRTIAVVDFGASSTTFSVLRNLKVVYTRDFSFGGQQLTEEIMRTYGLRWRRPGARRRKAGCRPTTRPRCSTRSSTT